MDSKYNILHATTALQIRFSSDWITLSMKALLDLSKETDQLGCCSAHIDVFFLFFPRGIWQTF